MNTRIVTGLALILIVGLVAYLDKFYLTWSFLGVVYMFALQEANNLFKVDVSNKKLVLVFGAFSWLIPILPVNPISAMMILLVIFASLIAYSPKIKGSSILPFIYPAISFILFFELYETFGVNVIIWLIITVSLTDTMAYFVGKTIGKRKFSETSPNKTLEGVFGGIFFGTLFSVIFFDLLSSEFNIFYTILLSLAVSVSSVFGDLFESYLKRQAGVKDSGNILPGHGGILDRMDGFLFAIILLFIFKDFII